MVLVFFHWVEYVLQFESFNPLVFCHLWNCYGMLITLASCWAAFPHLGKKNFHTEKSSPERRTHLEWVSSFWIPLELLAECCFLDLIIICDAKVRTRQGFFPLQTMNGAGVLSPSRVSFAIWKLQASSFVSFVRLLWGNDHASITMCHFAPFWKWVSFTPKKSTPKRKTHIECVEIYWSQLKTLEQLHWSHYKWAIGGKKVSVVFHCKPPLGLMFLHWVDFTLNIGSFKPPDSCHLWDTIWQLPH